jgi:DNA-binding FadR family transcriptional regulator
VHDLTRWAKGVRAATHGDVTAAVHHLARMRLETVSLMAAPDRIEAAVRAGDTTAARRWVEEVGRFAGRHWLPLGHRNRRVRPCSAG